MPLTKTLEVSMVSGRKGGTRTWPAQGHSRATCAALCFLRRTKVQQREQCQRLKGAKRSKDARDPTV